MKLLDSVLRLPVPMFGFGVRWLMDEIHAAGITVHVTRPCLNELVADAEQAVMRDGAASDSYVSRLRRELIVRAEFLRAWTMSDEPVGEGALTDANLVKVARRHSLPRLWRLSDPVASAARHPTPTYLYWASAG